MDTALINAISTLRLCQSVHSDTNGNAEVTAHEWWSVHHSHVANRIECDSTLCGNMVVPKVGSSRAVCHVSA